MTLNEIDERSIGESISPNMKLDKIFRLALYLLSANEATQGKAFQNECSDGQLIFSL